MSEALEAEVAAALERGGLRVRAFRRISNTPAPSATRSAYRIDLDSGRSIKARRLEDEECARRLFELRRHLPDAFAAAFGCDGAVLLEDWIDGEELAGGLPNDAQLVDAASLLAQLHATPPVAGQRLHERRSTAVWRDEADRCLTDICAAGELDTRSASSMHAALERLDPKLAIAGLVHTDFCGENMVVDRMGRLRIVDNERVGIDALGFDVARTWYRWALPAPAWERFRSVYAARAPSPEPLETLPFWSLVAVVHSGALRLRTDPARAYVPLERLRRMAVELTDRGALLP